MLRFNQWPFYCFFAGGDLKERGQVSPTVPKAGASPSLPRGCSAPRVRSRRHRHGTDVTVPYPHAQSRRLPRLRGSDGDGRVSLSPSPWSIPICRWEEQGVTLAPLRPGSGLSVEVPVFAVPVPITRSDNQLPSASVTSPGRAAACFG